MAASHGPVGFVGLGIMGRPMAENLSQRFQVWGVDPQPARFEGIQGVEKAPSLSLLAQKCSTVCLSLPGALVESVVLGEGGLIHDLAPGSLVLDLSTGVPSVSRKIAAALAAKGIDYADCPVSGGEAGAQSGSLAIMVGASEAVLARSMPYLRAMGKSVVRAGETGAGHVAKLINNMIVGVTFSAVAEGFALAVDNGLDPSRLYQAIKGGWAGSPVLDVSAPAIASGQFVPGGTIDMILKDLGYAEVLARESGVDVPMTAGAREIFTAAQKAGWGRESQPAIFKLWQKVVAP